MQALRAPIVAGGRSIDISASVGIATADASTPAEIVLRNADLAMYSAKRSGKRRSADYDSSMHSDALARLELKVDLERALARDELYLVYQPIVDLADDRVIGVESLLRWRHPERGIVAPGEFIALAEETGAIVPIGRWVLGEACRQAATWRDASPAASDLNVGVNLSPRQLELPDFVADVERALAGSGLPGDRLVVELTEGMGVRDLAGAHETLTALRKRGVRISIDDFGTGFTSLSYLRRLPIDSLKIDRAFITDIATDPHARRLLEGLLRLAGGLQVTSVAEGVETPEQLAMLRSMRCDLAQGYLLSRPLAAEDVLDRVHADCASSRHGTALADMPVSGASDRPAA